jgi:carboxymethylenebutenolidase
MSGQYITTVAAHFPHRMAAAASLYGVGIITDKEDSPHLLLDKIEGELYYAFAEIDQSVPARIPGQLKQALDKADAKHELKVKGDLDEAKASLAGSLKLKPEINSLAALRAYVP